MATSDVEESVPPAAPASIAAHILPMTLLTLLNFSSYLDRAVLAILQEPIKHDLMLADWQLGLLSGTAFAVFYSVVGVPAGRLADRSDRVTILSAALALWSLMTVLCGVAANYTQLLLARLGVGAAEGACTPASHSMVADTFPPHRRGLALAIITASNPISKMAAPLIGGAVAAAYGWRAAFFAVGVPGLLLALAMRLLLKDAHRASRQRAVADRVSFLADLRRLLALPNFRWLLLGSAMMSAGVVTTDFFTASFLQRSFDVSLKQAGFALAAGPGLAGLAGTFLGGYLADRFAGRSGRSYSYVCAAGAVAAGVLFLVAFGGVGLGAVIPLVIVANLLLNMKNGANFAAAQNMAPSDMRATAAAVLMVFIIVIGNGLGPMLTGWLSDHVAALAFPASVGEFSQLCPGGRAVPAAPRSTIEACLRASDVGLRRALLLPCAAYLLSGVFFWRAGRRTSTIS